MKAQESETSYHFLELPVSAHAAALGGDNISIVEDDASLVFHNPALIVGVTDKTINLNYMNFMSGVNTASASFVRTAGERASWGVMGQFLDYGSMKQTTADNEIIGDFSAKDIMVGGSFAYLLSDKISGGISAKFISSSIAGYNSFAVGVDLGLNYFHEDMDLSVSAVVKNLGGQVKAYDDVFERLPVDVQLGFTKRLVGAPLRFSATMVGLNHWEGGLARHLVFGLDLLLSEQIYLAGGYNCRRADEMKVSDGEDESSHGAAFSFGGGLQLERFKLQASYAKYHVSSNSLMFSVSYTL